MISIVVPVLNEADCLLALWQRLTTLFAQQAYSCEIIFVDDASSDGTWDLISQLHREDPRVKGIRLARHSGHQVALFAGLRFASGDGVVTLDGDLQHPPEKIPDFIEAWERGADVAYGYKIEHRGRSFAKKYLNRAFHRLFSLRCGVPLHPETSDFQILDCRLAAKVAATWDPSFFLRGWIHSLAQKRTEIPYRAGKRFHGKSKQNMLALLWLGLRSLLFFPSLSATPSGILKKRPAPTVFCAIAELLGFTQTSRSPYALL